MRKMKDSGIPWIGKIPCSWNVSRLKYLLRSERGAIKAGPFGSSLQAQDMRGSDVKVYNQRTVLDNDFTSGDDYVSFEKYRELLGFRVDSGDLLVTTRGTIGKTAIVPMNFQPGILHPCLIKLKLNEQVVNLKLLSLVFNSTNILLEQLRLASNATTIDVIYTHNLLDILFPLAPVHQQTEILKYLNDKCGQIDSVIAAKEKTNEALKAYRQSVIYEAVTKGLDPAAPLKDTNIPWIGKIPCSWNVSRLKYLLRSERGAIKAGPFGSSLQAQDMRGSDVKVYNQRTVLDNDFTSGDDYVSFEKYRELLGFRVDSGDLLVTTRGTIGKTAIVPMNFQPGILHPCLIKLKLNEQVVNLKLLSLVFNSTNILLEQLRLASNATTIDVIYTHNLLDILFPLAPAHQQTEILKYLNDKCGQIDAVIAANESIVKKLREYRQSLIYEAVTGKIACD